MTLTLVAKSMSLYVQLLKTNGNFVTRDNPAYVKVVETKGHFVAKAMFGKIELNYWFFFCDIQSWGHNV